MTFGSPAPGGAGSRRACTLEGRPGKALVETRALVKRFGAFTAVDGISFSVDRGEVVGFLGPNGAGKSTTMKLIAGFSGANGRSAAIGGHDSQTDAVAARKLLVYLPEAHLSIPT